MEIIEREELLQIMDYNEDTGEVTDKLGNNLLRTDSKGGYVIRAKGRAYQAGKLVYYYATGYYPHRRGEIVYKDTDKTNLKLTNLHRVGDSLCSEYIIYRYTYCPDTGNLFHKGKRVGISDGAGGLKVSIEGRYYGVHNIVVAITDNLDPGTTVSHIDGDRSNNKRENLKIGVRTDNTSGVPGVTWSDSAQRWVARYKDKYLGSSTKKSEAIKLRKDAEDKV